MRASIVLAAALALAPATARADQRWYGDQVLIADTLGWGLIGGAFATRTYQLAVLGAATIVVGGPGIHLGHGNYGRAGISLGLRTVGPILGLAVGVAGGRNDDHELTGNAPVVGLVLGWVIAQTVDIAYLAREDGPAPTPRMISIGGSF